MSVKRLLPLLVALALVGVACGGKDDPAVSAGSTAGHNAADVTFAQSMVPHHEQAVEMADMAIAKASDPKVKDLATRIKQAQGPEITTMKGWLADWGESAAGGGHNSGDMEMGGSGMMSAQEMGDLEKSSGAGFDRMFLTMMIRHHEGAVEMATTESNDGRFEPAKALAQQISSAQKAEIAEMTALLETAK